MPSYLAGGCPAKSPWPHLCNVLRDGVKGPRERSHKCLDQSLSSGSLLDREPGCLLGSDMLVGAFLESTWLVWGMQSAAVLFEANVSSYGPG